MIFPLDSIATIKLPENPRLKLMTGLESVIFCIDMIVLDRVLLLLSSISLWWHLLLLR